MSTKSMLAHNQALGEGGVRDPKVVLLDVNGDHPASKMLDASDEVDDAFSRAFDQHEPNDVLRGLLLQSSILVGDSSRLREPIVTEQLLAIPERFQKVRLIGVAVGAIHTAVRDEVSKRATVERTAAVGADQHDSLTDRNCHLGAYRVGWGRICRKRPAGRGSCLDKLNADVTSSKKTYYRLLVRYGTGVVHPC